ncbi:MAG: hypothetical protein AAB970_01510 [Patescibacteria group bacterium]
MEASILGNILMSFGISIPILFLIVRAIIKKEKKEEDKEES